MESLVQIGVIAPNQSDLGEIAKQTEKPYDVGRLNQLLFDEGQRQLHFLVVLPLEKPALLLFQRFADVLLLVNILSWGLVLPRLLRWRGILLQLDQTWFLAAYRRASRNQGIRFLHDHHFSEDLTLVW